MYSKAPFSDSQSKWLDPSHQVVCLPSQAGRKAARAMPAKETMHKTSPKLAHLVPLGGSSALELISYTALFDLCIY